MHEKVSKFLPVMQLVAAHYYICRLPSTTSAALQQHTMEFASEDLRTAGGAAHTVFATRGRFGPLDLANSDPDGYGCSFLLIDTRRMSLSQLRRMSLSSVRRMLLS
jgi:hypothetical protein